MAKVRVFEQSRTGKAVEAPPGVEDMFASALRVGANATIEPKDRTRERGTGLPLRAKRTVLPFRRGVDTEVALRRVKPPKIAASLRHLLLLAALLLALPSFAADSFPAAPVQLTLPYSPGTGPDALARRLAELMARQWKQSVIVVNKPGANGWLAAGEVKGAPRDGRAVLMSDTTMFGLHPLVFKSMPFDADRDFEPVAPLFSTHFFIVVAGDAPWKSIADLVADASRRPGTMTAGAFGTVGINSAGIANFETATRTRMNVVPYKSLQDMLNDVATRRVDWSFCPAGSLAPLLKSGRLRALAIAAPKRLPSYPDVPTVTEGGGPSGFELHTHVALFASPGTPSAVRGHIQAAVASALRDPTMQGFLEVNGYEPWAGSERDVASAILADRRRFADIAPQLKPN